ncbi:MAG TPA: serine/threonine-protein kinase [Candidatus Aquilonibacter sp.]|nr:serine/threonine-protein kinase [Candidatus Aquilonibacter sp.]
MLKKLGKYELIEIIGRGGMGEVYKAQDPLIGRLVALKTITNGLAGRPDLLERFHQEARSAGTLQHPNIVTIYELGQEGETPFIAMEFLEGESLEGLIERRPVLPIAEKVGYVIPVCRALNFAHKRGVIHRDIKPANVMITREGRVKVVDFGIARQIDSKVTQTDAIIGTLAYMSPQQICGERADERSDIWATGVMLYELLTFQRPFDGANQAALVLNISKGDVLPPCIRALVPDCGPALEAVVDRMLSKDVERRYQNMEQILNALEGVSQRLKRPSAAKPTLGEDLVRTTMPTVVRPPSSGAPTISQPKAPQTPPAVAGSAKETVAPPASLAANAKNYKKPIAIAAGVLALLLIANWVWKSRPSAADNAAEPAPASASDAGAVPGHGGEPVAPGVIATTAELSQPWAAKKFIFHDQVTSQYVPAMVVRLPSGAYWAFSLIEPYGTCRLEYVTDLQKLAKTYDYPADHPLVVDPCSDTLFDLLHYGGPMNDEVRGEMVRGSAVRPPIAIEVQQRGDSILATQIEPQ